ncbi:MAG: hypothetical protein ACI4LC_00435 [Emergencia sp.]
MELEQLYDFLDIEHGGQFEYFENFADLVETSAEIEDDVLYELIKEVELKTFAELAESYFYETLESVPGDQIDFYNLLENIKRTLIGLSETACGEEKDQTLVKLADELNRFRRWFTGDALVECRDVMTGKTEFMTVRDALTASRLEKLTRDEHLFDFSRATDYPIEEYIMTLADLVE